MCRCLCLVIRTVNDRDAWGDAEKRLVGGGGGQRERGPLVLPGIGAADLSQTRALLPATIACVVIVLKAWRPPLLRGPPLVCVCVCVRLSLFGNFFFLIFSFFFFSPLPPACGLLDVFVLGAKVNWRRNKERRKTLAWPRSCVTFPSYRRPAMFKLSFFSFSFPLFSLISFFFVLLSALCVMPGSEAATLRNLHPG